MARKTRNGVHVEDISAEEMAAARKQARAKLARQMAEQELGISDDSVPVVKGPMAMPDEQQVVVTVDLAPFQDRLRIDDVYYMQGVSYPVGQRLAAVLNEQMSRSWRHQAEIEGKDHEFYLKNRIATRPVNVNLSTTQNLHRVPA